jgi:hypothetical protein
MASKITVTTLKAGAAILGLEIGDLKKKKDLEALIDEHLSDKELGYECPECGKDIPDVDVCPYCGESFVDGEDEEGAADSEETNEEETAEDPAEEEAPEEAANDEAPEEDPLPEEMAEEVAKEVTKKADKAKGKGKDKVKEKDADAEDKSANRGRPVGKSKNTEEKEKEFNELVEQIDSVLGDGFEKRERKTGITYVQDRKRLLKAVSTGKTLSIEFNVEIKSDNDNLKKYTEEEAKERHLGSTRAIYTLGYVATAIKLVKEALKAK